MLVDVVQVEYFSKNVRILEEERDRYVNMANNFYLEHITKSLGQDLKS